MLSSSKTPDLTASSGDPRPAKCLPHVARVPAAVPRRRSLSSMPQGQEHWSPLLFYLDHPVVASKESKLPFFVVLLFSEWLEAEARGMGRFGFVGFGLKPLEWF